MAIASERVGVGADASVIGVDIACGLRRTRGSSSCAGFLSSSINARHFCSMV